VVNFLWLTAQHYSLPCVWFNFKQDARKFGKNYWEGRLLLAKLFGVEWKVLAKA
jgi:hypothetical protein